jgi:cytochrome c-type biogenesis protein CcmF
MIRWVWLGAILMMFGGLIAATERRLRQTVVEREPEPAAPARDALPAAARTAAGSA